MSDETTPTVYDICLQSASAYTAGYNPQLEHMPFVDRFELHLQRWANRSNYTGGDRR